MHRQEPLKINLHLNLKILKLYFIYIFYFTYYYLGVYLAVGPLINIIFYLAVYLAVGPLSEKDYNQNTQIFFIIPIHSSNSRSWVGWVNFILKDFYSFNSRSWVRWVVCPQKIFIRSVHDRKLNEWKKCCGLGKNI